MSTPFAWARLKKRLQCIFHTIASVHAVWKIQYSVDGRADPGGPLGFRDSLQKYIKEAKRMMYWYKNTLKCIIS